MRHVIQAILFAAALACGGNPGSAKAANDVVRGLTIGGMPGAPGTKAGQTCDNFTKEETQQSGTMSGASVNCGADTDTLIRTLPLGFTAYCTVPESKLKSATLLKAPLKDNRYHCDLSGITPKDAIGQFGGAIWR